MGQRTFRNLRQNTAQVPYYATIHILSKLKQIRTFSHVTAKNIRQFDI